MEAEALKGFQQQALDKVGALRQQGFNNAMNNAFRSAQGLQGVGSQAFNMGQAINQQQMQQGQMQQAAMQSLITAAKGQYGQYANAPMNKLQLPLAALGAAPVPQTQTQDRQLGIMDHLTAGASFATGMPSFMG